MTRVNFSELIRTMVDEKLQSRQERARRPGEKRLRALAAIEEHAREALARRGGNPIKIDPAAVISENREERDDELLGRLHAGRP